MMYGKTLYFTGLLRKRTYWVSDPIKFLLNFFGHHGKKSYGDFFMRAEPQGYRELQILLNIVSQS